MSDEAAAEKMTIGTLANRVAAKANSRAPSPDSGSGYAPRTAFGLLRFSVSSVAIEVSVEDVTAYRRGVFSLTEE